MQTLANVETIGYDFLLAENKDLAAKVSVDGILQLYEQYRKRLWDFLDLEERKEVDVEKREEEVGVDNLENYYKFLVNRGVGEEAEIQWVMWLINQMNYLNTAEDDQRIVDSLMTRLSISKHTKAAICTTTST